MLYSNQNLLNKYNKTIPKTWDELIDTGIFIMSEEKKLNKDIIVYTADITGKIIKKIFINNI